MKLIIGHQQIVGIVKIVRSLTNTSFDFFDNTDIWQIIRLRTLALFHAILLNGKMPP